MSGLKNSPFGKRLRASHHDVEEKATKRNRPHVNPIFGCSTLSLDSRTTSDSSGGLASPIDHPTPRKIREYGDRFLPSRDGGDMRTSFQLMDARPLTPSKSRIIPSESDALKEQANAIFNSILHTEVTPPSPHRRPVSPTRPTASGSIMPSTPIHRCLFAHSLPSTSNPATPTRRLDTPTDEAYSMSPVRAASRQFHSVCKTPYRVLNAPELADDIYLNLVDRSSTNVLDRRVLERRGGMCLLRCCEREQWECGGGDTGLILMTGIPATVPSPVTSHLSTLIRHEIIALNFAISFQGTAFLPSCPQLKAAGSSTDAPKQTGLVLLGGYSDNAKQIYDQDAFVISPHDPLLRAL
ncbi:hypothetical protein BDQ12DRAFT_669965 [Crucibulum laeve]|uniref:Uncharacterized protein n=1 Tax=Crucibulum laeve TaxID=68775 RepID=A0A5C3LYI8_9AGAR|nr:hypothetical protein BDQ12DRAFT_669965 [Crucibulum laeve]